MNLPTPTALLFDWDNTIVNTWPTIHRALNDVLEKMGHAPWSMDTVKTTVKKSMRDSFPELFGDRWEEAAGIYQAAYRAIHLEDLQPLDGARELLEWLSQTPLYVALVSNKRGPTLREEAEHLGFTGYFDRLIGADDAERDKPHPAPALMALDGSGIAPSPAVWFIGDTAIDLECAQNTGLTPILYGDAPLDEGGTLEGHAFAAHMRDHEALLALLKH